MTAPTWLLLAEYLTLLALLAVLSFNFFAILKPAPGSYRVGITCLAPGSHRVGKDWGLRPPGGTVTLAAIAPSDTLCRFIMLNVLYFARLRESLGRETERLDLPPDVADIAGLTALLRARGDAWERELAPGRSWRVAVNQDMAHAGTPVRDGDEVAFFPPVTGG